MQLLGGSLPYSVAPLELRPLRSFRFSVLDPLTANLVERIDLVTNDMLKHFDTIPLVGTKIKAVDDYQI